ncbi:hypothetical protein LOTGIDRAFT_154829 [Lottia gigantea]|uniref:Uncharacterized protein n=1 Tax=Lottia gigantea TaxID=225164 RepID=V4A231_LOTGI|nr:hypothetical protein LOTGIDRAFT_154829 [Lottia gigantea]ESO87331.1 hypothetical protein LOTGIDRAFT_154829 [Lottia gigantea]
MAITEFISGCAKIYAYKLSNGQTLCKRPDETTKTVDTVIATEKSLKYAEEAKKKKKKKNVKLLRLAITQLLRLNLRKSSVFTPGKEELESLDAALIKSVGPRGMTDIVPSPEWTADEWMPVVLNFCTVEEYHPRDSNADVAWFYLLDSESVETFTWDEVPPDED